MEAVMKSIVPAALVVVLEAGFLFGIAALPRPTTHIRARAEVASRQPAGAVAAPVVPVAPCTVDPKPASRS
jgi:hypothetical protein